MKEYKRVIIVDDNDTTIFLHTDLVNDLFSNVDVITFSNPEEFLKQALKTPDWFETPSLLLLDISMPGMYGYEVLEELDEEIEDIDLFEVIMVTSSNLKRDVERADRFTNVKGYIEKPLDEEKLKALLG